MPGGFMLQEHNAPAWSSCSKSKIPQKPENLTEAWRTQGAQKLHYRSFFRIPCAETPLVEFLRIPVPSDTPASSVPYRE